MSSIFIKQGTPTAAPTATTTPTVTTNAMLDIIPPNCLPKPDAKQALTKLEFRWRFYNIPNKTTNTIVEMSQQPPNKPRTYLTTNGTWTTGNVNELDNYKQFIVKELYYYTDT